MNISLFWEEWICIIEEDQRQRRLLNETKTEEVNELGCNSSVQSCVSRTEV